MLTPLSIPLMKEYDDALDDLTSAEAMALIYAIEEEVYLSFYSGFFFVNYAVTPSIINLSTVRLATAFRMDYIILHSMPTLKNTPTYLLI